MKYENKVFVLVDVNNCYVSYTFPEPTDFAPKLAKAATLMLNHIYEEGIKYKKIGIGPCFLLNRNWSMSRDKLSRNPFRSQ